MTQKSRKDANDVRERFRAAGGDTYARRAEIEKELTELPQCCRAARFGIACVTVDVAVKGRAKAVDEGDGAEPRARSARRVVVACRTRRRE